MKLKNLVLLCAGAALALMFVTSCVPPTSFGPVDNRPGIPVPDSYSSEVAPVSDELIVESVVPSSFNPIVTKANDASGTLIYDGAGVRAVLMNDGEYVTDPTVPTATGTAVTLTEADGPRFAFIRYWRRIGDAEYFPGGVTIERTHSVTHGASETTTNTFSETISIEAEASAGGLFASGSVKTSASFTATQEFTSTVSTEETVEETFIASPPPEVSFIYSVWQLVEEYRFIDADGALYDHDRYDFDPGSLRFVFPTDEVIPIIFTYKNQ